MAVRIIVTLGADDSGWHFYKTASSAGKAALFLTRQAQLKRGNSIDKV
jgi:hypothetical protein